LNEPYNTQSTAATCRKQNAEQTTDNTQIMEKQTMKIENADFGEYQGATAGQG